MTKARKIELVQQLAVSFGLKFPTKHDLTDAIAAVNGGAGSDLGTLEGKVTTNENAIATTLATLTALSQLVGTNKTAGDDAHTAITDDINTYKAGMDAKIKSISAKLGSRVGSAATYAELPTTDQNGEAITAGDTATLTATDGAHPAGLYEFDGAVYVLNINYDAINLTNITAGLVATQEEVDAGVINDKFVTPATLDSALTQAEVNSAAGAE